MYSSLITNFPAEKQYLVSSLIYFWQEINPVSLWIKGKVNQQYLLELQEVLFLDNIQSREFSPKFFASLKEIKHKFNNYTNKVLMEYINTLRASKESLLVYKQDDLENYYKQLVHPIIVTCLQVIFDKELDENTFVPTQSINNLAVNILKLQSVKNIFELNKYNLCPVAWESLASKRLLPQDFSTESVIVVNNTLREFVSEYISNVKSNIESQNEVLEPSLNSINNTFKSIKEITLKQISELEKENYSQIIKIHSSQPQDTELVSQVALIADKQRTSWFKILLNKLTNKLSPVR